MYIYTETGKLRESVNGFDSIRFMNRFTIFTHEAFVLCTCRTLFDAAVLRAGPAGLFVVATLLDNGTSNILWIDPYFDSGRLERYREVPCNSTVSLFISYALSWPSLAALSSEPLTPLTEKQPEEIDCHAEVPISLYHEQP